MSKINKQIYTLNQEELRNYIISILEEKNIKYDTDSHGNIWSIKYKDRAVIVSHMDTVAHSDREYHNQVFEINNLLFKIDTILGADDRAGVNLILNHIDKINFILTVDEEVGGIGASALSTNKKFLNDVKDASCFIEFDRKGDSDLLGALHGYCQEDLSKVILSILPTYKEARGVFTDVDKLKHIKASVNLSVGYYNAHSKNEVLDIKHFEYLDSKIEELASITGDFKIYVPKVTSIKPWSSKLYNRHLGFYDDFDDELVTCSICHNKVPLSETADIQGEICCFDCIEELANF